MKYTYKSGVVGGTFDKFHMGHKALLKFAFSHAEIVYVTITSDVYTTLHKPLAMPFLIRKKTVEAFLKKEGYGKRARVVAIDDVYGITIDANKLLEAIFVTEDSLLGAQMVNKKRKKKGLTPLAIEIMPFVDSETGIALSSTHIRKGIFDTEGKLLIKKEYREHVAFLPDSLRDTLHQPFGTLVKKISKNSFRTSDRLIAVGDVSVRNLHKAGFSPSISVIDFLVERKKQKPSLKALGLNGHEVIFHAENPAGTITPSLWEVIKEGFRSEQQGEKIVISVEGEEDLAVLPAILLAQEGYLVCYGQPQSGMVIVRVQKSTKVQALELLEQFITNTTRGH